MRAAPYLADAASRLGFHAAIVRVLIVRMVAEAGENGIEAFPSGSEIDKRGEYSGVLVEEELHAFKAASTAFWRNLTHPLDLAV